MKVGVVGLIFVSIVIGLNFRFFTALGINLTRWDDIACGTSALDILYKSQKVPCKQTLSNILNWTLIATQGEHK
jgi:hypothetical protein